MNANGPAGGNRPSHRSATLEGNRIMQSLPNTPDAHDGRDYLGRPGETDAQTRARLADAATRYTSAAEYREHEARDFAYSTRSALMLTDAEVDLVWPADSNDPAAISARLDAEAAPSLAAHRERITALARRAARVNAQAEPLKTLALARFAAELLAPRTAGAR